MIFFRNFNVFSYSCLGSLELDNPPNSNLNNVREKRKHSHNDSVQGVPSSGTLFILLVIH